MSTLIELEKRIEFIEKRNAKVEADKAWETSIARKMIILVNTYIVIGLFMWVIDISDPWIHAIVPTIGFFLSTLSLPFVKKRWITRTNR